METFQPTFIFHPCIAMIISSHVILSICKSFWFNFLQLYMFGSQDIYKLPSTHEESQDFFLSSTDQLWVTEN